MNKTHQIDPHSHTNNRTEFRLNNYNSIIYTNIRLADIGTTPDNVNALYNYNGGVMNLVKSISLYAGNQQLDKIDNFNKWNGFKNLIGTQDEANGIKQPNMASNLSIISEFPLIASNQDIIKATGFTGKFLLSLPIMDATNSFFYDDLRVVIEWNTASAIVFIEANRPADFTISLPSLIYNEFITPDYMELKKEAFKQPIVWNSIENDRLAVPAVLNAVPQPIDTRIRGFDNKTVNRMVVVNDSSHPNSLCCQTHSVAMNQEKLNFRVNGRVLMPYDGINNENQKLRSLNAWGKTTVYQGGQYTQETEAYIDGSLRSMAGQFSYASVDIKQKINDLNIQYYRVGKTGVPVEDTSFLDAMNIYMFAEVLKFASVDQKGNIKVMYA